MPTAPTYPGVHVDEGPTPARTIAGVATSITAFVGRARRGPVDRPVRVQGLAEFDRRFGGLWRESPMTYAVQQFFLNGGTDALVVRVFHAGDDGDAQHVHARFELPGDGGSLMLRAADPGLWGNRLELFVDHGTADPDDALVFDLTVNEVRDGVTVAFEVRSAHRRSPFIVELTRLLG